MLYFLILYIFLIFLFSSTHCQAQDTDSAFEAFKKQANQEMSDYTKKTKKDFDDFRSQADSEFHQMLIGKWKSFSTQKPTIVFTKPIPIDIVKKDKGGADLNRPSAQPKNPEITKPPVTIKEKSSPIEKEKPKEDVAVKVPTTTVKPKPITEPTQDVPSQVESESNNNVSYRFYQIPLIAPIKELKKWPIFTESISNLSIAAYWDNASKQNIKPWLSFLEYSKKTVGGGDYAIYQLITSISNDYYTNDVNTAKMFTWFLLLQGGYDVKVAYNGNKIYLLVNSEKQLYGKSYYIINNNNYYYLENGKENPDNLSICDKSFSLAKNSLNATVNPALRDNDTVLHYYNFKFRNKLCQIPLSYCKPHIRYFEYYPQMSFSEYNVSEEGVWFDEQLSASFQPYLQNLNTADKVQFLLSFTQLAFEYKTDDEQFGRQKWYFPEEILYYPYSCCHDRAVMFAYLVRKLVGLRVIGLLYPNHICNAVEFPEGTSVKGAGITYKNRNYIICDPTYLGADIGMVMPQFENVSPTVSQ